MTQMTVSSLAVRIAHLEGAYEQVADRLNGIDRRLETLDQKMESRFNQVDQKFLWMMGLMVTSWVTIILTILFHH